MADEATNDMTTTRSDATEQSDGAKQRDQRRAMAAQYAQQNWAERLFPGPSRERSEQSAKHIEGLLRSLQGGQSARERAGSRKAAVTSPTTPAATQEDITQLHETLEKQNELLQAILSTQVDTQNDARSTAQNSRTFAWAGSAIAILTLVATVISVVAAIQGH